MDLDIEPSVLQVNNSSNIEIFLTKKKLHLKNFTCDLKLYLYPWL